MYGGQRASRDLSLERAKSDRCVHQTPLHQHTMYHEKVQTFKPRTDTRIPSQRIGPPYDSLVLKLVYNK